mmetsp:Transcript_2961/g.5210  ORF Transcript_2961/g.5210 Transcript_2961/m.5210 type:complete len:97 (+) Transcript_2961:80-370(+)
MSNDLSREEAAFRSLEQHKLAFEAIIEQYGLKEDSKASAIADFLTDNAEQELVSATEFANKFGMNESEARIFLAWIAVGIKFKEETNLNVQTLKNQ